MREIAEQVKERVLEISVIGDGEGYPKNADAIYQGSIVASRI